MDTRWRKAFEKVKKVKKVGKQSLTKRVIDKSLVERGKKVFTMKKKIFCFVLVLLLMTQLTPSVTAATQGWQLDENQQWTYLENNVKVVGWQRINQKWYYFDSNGIMRTGWQIINQKWYFFANSGEMVTGWLLWNQNWYHLAPSGEMVINWQRIQNQWYYFDGGGRMLVGWQRINNQWYYLASSGQMLTKWQFYNQKWYYLASDGTMVTGWAWIDSHWHYFDSSGAMQTGWVLFEGKWYYLNPSGAMQIGWIFQNNQWYYLQRTGDWFENETTQFIRTILPDALEVSANANLFPSVMMAQTSIESALGTSLLAREANNYFGMKFKVGEDEGKYDVYYKETLEYDAATGQWITVVAPFRKYASRIDSFNDYALKLRNGLSWDPLFYKGTWRENAANYREATAALQGKYATDPNYATKLNNFIEAWQLYLHD